MRALRHIAVGIVALLCLALAGLWLVPPLLDWDRYRGEVEQLASAALGQTVRIEGAIALRLLPQPLLEAGGVAVDAHGGGRLAARQLRLRLALGPLLGGRMDAQELVLRGADIRLPWPLEPGALALRSSGWLSSLSARLEDGQLSVGEVAVTGIDATLETGEHSGSFLSAGRARAGGRDWRFSVRVSRPGGDGAVGLEVALEGQGAAQGLAATMSGQVQADGTMLGRITARGPDLSQLLTAPAVPFRAEGRASFGGGLLAADELVGDVAGAPVQGAVALRLSPVVRLDVALAASRLDLDSWSTALLNGAEAGALARMPVGLDLSAEVATLGGGALRVVRGALDFAGDVAGGRVTVRELRATLPGDAVLQLEGVAGHAEPGRRALRFDGKMKLAAPALPTTIDWALANGPFGQVVRPPGVLRTAEFEAALRVERDVVQISGLVGRVDGARVAANLSLGLEGRPSLRALVALERLELDPWLPEAWPGLAGAAEALGGLALDLQLEAKSARFRGTAIAPLALELAGEPGRLVLRRLEARAEGVGISASGTLLEGGRVAEARVDLRAVRAGAMAALLPNAVAGWPERLPGIADMPLLFQAQASGAPASLGIKLAAELGDLRLEATPTLDAASGRWAGTLGLRHPGASRLAEALGKRDAAAWLGDGSFALQAQLAGQERSVAAESFDIAAGLLRARGALRWTDGAVPRLAGRVVAETLPLPHPNARGAEPVALAALLGWAAELRLEAGQLLVAQEPVLESASATLGLERGVLRVDIGTAKLAGGELAAGLRVDATARPPALALEARLNGAAVAGPVFGGSLDIVAGRFDLALALSAAGFSPDGLLAGLAGRISLRGRDGALAGFDLGRMGSRLEEADVRAGLAGGQMRFRRLEADVTVERGGLGISSLTAEGPDGRVAATGSVDLARSLLALRLALVPAVPDAPEIGLRLSGPYDRLQRVPELAGATRWRNERAGQ